MHEEETIAVLTSKVVVDVEQDEGRIESDVQMYDRYIFKELQRGF